MRLCSMPSGALTLSTLLLSQQVAAALIPDFLQSLDIFHEVEKRCSNPCGYYGQLCCQSGQYCYTDSNGQAACGEGSGSGGSGQGSWVYTTTTYVETDLQTVTATYSSYIPAATPVATQQCSYSQGQTPCGSTCCQSGYYCSNSQCIAVPGGSSGYYSQLYTVTTVITNTAGAPLRPTTETILTLTSTGITGTTAFQTPVGTSGVVLGESQSSGGLSGGAIAGIVIGVILGIILLILICACCCFKGLIDGLLAIFGLGKRRKRVTEETIIEERRSRRSGAGRTWFGARPGRTEVVEEKKDSGFGRGLGVATFLGTTAILLGLKRRSDRKEEEKTEISSSYGSYYSYDYTSDSSPSSITRTSRRSRSRR